MLKLLVNSSYCCHSSSPTSFILPSVVVWGCQFSCWHLSGRTGTHFHWQPIISLRSFFNVSLSPLVYSCCSCAHPITSPSCPVLADPPAPSFPVSARSSAISDLHGLHRGIYIVVALERQPSITIISMGSSSTRGFSFYLHYPRHLSK